MTMPSAEDVRAEVKAWLEENWNPDLTVGEWWDILARSGYAAPTFPEDCWGKGWTRDLAMAVNETIAQHQAIGPPAGLGYLLAAPTIVAHGNQRQKQEDLLRILNGQDAWCQLFSEPGAGSDLAGLSTRAIATGDEWVVRGQKVWTSRGAYAQRGLLLARHDPSVRKHQGITAFGIDMHANGVDVRPLRQMNGDAHFTEVFLDDARVMDSDRIGAVGEGWRVALTCLSYERGASTAGGTSGLLDVNRLIALARSLGRTTEPSIRDALARLFIETRVMGYTARRARDAARAGRPGPEGSGMKLRGSKMFRDYTALAMRLLGPAAVCDPHDELTTLFLTAPSLSIRGGTDEIQRNIVGERVLGLPEEPRVDRELPFEELPR
jgi:alkylation response protein AidB-like acyl-CoA dehydrogenase